ncbi:restriction endonuclease subunit S [Brevibacillus laterosporus]|uniref:Restriction endonuclease subunit S n=1 Tax=Brevibacillus laterosporus TaxID=1465 RepID=A0AAP3G9C6_BRELA|nr:restriction endonuclease subunit S [Brevibacillus laterosporus]MCR8978646.1 restriction endonuclease subunit S [Brevibacillus laterosporus]MCZ0805802.1 restriction endonuclease subunit S [Brevibacillus laterosporus]MCZ0824432.1 restriction endonuclease subunit S [Brevibacillus laterosporus]MCZ0848336.1 restriction endonuclease subunit S [Brevibacillus laterosporus]
MSDKITKSPQIRFAGYTDAWEQRKLEDLADFSKGNGYSKSDLTDEGKPVILYGRLYTKYETVMESIDTYTIEKEKSVISKGNEVIVPASGETSEDISRAAVVSESGIILGGDLNIVRPRNEIDPVFLALTISNGKQQKELSKRAQGKSVVHLHNSDIKEVNLLFPRKEEQIKIGNFFKQFDKTIALHQRKYDKLVIVKKSMLKKMFPKEGANVPEIRFAGFTDAWEQRKLSEMTVYKNGKGHEDRQSNSGNYELINLNSISIDGGLKHSGKFIDDAEDTLLKDDLVMILSDVGHGDLLGRVALIPENNRFVLNQRVALLRPNETANAQFLFSYINSHQYYFKSKGAGMSQLNISKGSVENFKSFVPKLEEQRKIGEFFKGLDHLITLHQRELISLKNLKKSLLQQMFI